MGEHRYTKEGERIIHFDSFWPAGYTGQMSYAQKEDALKFRCRIYNSKGEIVFDGSKDTLPSSVYSD